jgi:histidinol-phosphate aminotransferase
MDWNALIRPEIAPMVPYAPGLRASEVRERSGRSVIRKLSSNESSYGPYPAAVAGMTAVLPHLNRYPDGAARALKRRLSEHVGVEERYLAVTNGSNELLSLIAQAVLDPCDEVVFAWPSFVVYPICTAVMGATAVKVPLTDGHVHDLPAMLEAITDRTKLVFLCNPNNPTGTIYDRQAFEEFLDHVPDHVLVVVDEAYFEFVESREYPNSIDYFDGTRPLAVLRTFSKIYGLAGIRVGYGALPPEMVAAIDKVREPFNVSTVGQVGAYYSLEDDAETTARRAENREQRALLCAALDELGVAYAPSSTNFVYALFNEPQEVFNKLLGEGVIVRDFGTAPALRIGIGTPDDTRATVAALRHALGRPAASA